MRILFSTFLFMLPLMSWTQDKPAYQLFDLKGKDVKYRKMIRELAKADIVFLAKATTTPLPTGCSWN